MSTKNAEPFPHNGLRHLSPRETLQRLDALRCTLPQRMEPRCSGQVHIGLFFDGTGNNMKLDYEDRPPHQRKHTYVVKLFLAHRLAPKDGYFRIYLPGVGTPFAEIGDSGGTRGRAFAHKGEDRITWALLQVLNTVHEYVRGARLMDDTRTAHIAQTLASIGSPAAQRRTALQTWQRHLAGALEGQLPRVEQINLSVFGFSRGAAAARAFVNWLFEVCTPAHGGWTFAGIPLRVGFMGLFDTVASVGMANLFDNGVLTGHQAWADGSMDIHHAVEQCVHYVAGHEVRACFPLDSVRTGHQYPANAKEVMFPGGHSDVGGGYAPGELGVSPSLDRMMAILPGVRMYHEARRAGVPLLPWDELRKDEQDGFSPSDMLIQDFNAYVRAMGFGPAPVEQLHRRHMGAYFHHRFRQRHTFRQRAPYTRASRQDQQALEHTQDCLIRRLATLGGGHPLEPHYQPQRAVQLHQAMHKAAGLQPSRADRYVYEVVEYMLASPVAPEVEHFFDHYVHDSMAGFKEQLNEYAKNGIGFVKFRTVFQGGH
ncbi:T6SS phospholipase effector Tle1-like catalytic domain-containing protein [Caldimonas sp.]|uniref:T6SS phospholipase effector Tle1-like catalytic domain-containing protein n=1 Tax=Caldimonas sp. TaxID=2838790 RepID=UPI00391ADDF7